MTFCATAHGSSSQRSVARSSRWSSRPGTYRFGHSMVRPSYRANLQGDNGGPFFGFVFDPSQHPEDASQPPLADPNDLAGGARAPRRFVGWQTFFDFGDGQVKPNKVIDTTISTPLFALPLLTIASHTPPVALPQRNLLRHVTWSLPSGQADRQAHGRSRAHPRPFHRSCALWPRSREEHATVVLHAARGRVHQHDPADAYRPLHLPRRRRQAWGSGSVRSVVALWVRSFWGSCGQTRPRTSRRIRAGVRPCPRAAARQAIFAWSTS